MEHFYQGIEGWFTFNGLYKRVVEKADNAHFVEVGGWLGRSAAYMAVEIINSGKKIKFDVVDIWDTSKHESYVEIIKRYGISPYEQFIKNMQSVLHVVEPVRMLSTDAAKKYANESLDFVYIDADHTYEALKEDITAWFPKVKQGGILGGHDYCQSFPGVIKIVDEVFKSPNVEEISWWVIKPIKIL